MFSWVVGLLMFIMASARTPKPRRDFEAMEKRRRRAAQMFKKGATQADVARELSVSRQSVSRWYQDWLAGGAKGLRGAGRAGRLPRLDKSQLKKVDRELKKGPLAHGFPTDMWTLARVGTVIEAVTGVAYHPGHVWKLLRELGWTLQRPARRAVERNDEAVARWVAKDWPRVKKTPADGAPSSSSKTSRGSHSFPR